MHTKNLVEKISMVYNKMKDEESKELFDLRAEYAIYHNKYDFINKIYKYAKGCCMSPIFENKLKKSKGIIVYGCGQEGTIAKRAIEACGHQVDYFADRNIPESRVHDGIKVISVSEAINNNNEYLFIIGSTAYALEMYTNLLRLGIGDEHIYLSEVGMVAGFNGNQYFDFFSSDRDEVFIDAGTYDGTTTENFMKWTSNTYKKNILF